MYTVSPALTPVTDVTWGHAVAQLLPSWEAPPAAGSTYQVAPNADAVDVRTADVATRWARIVRGMLGNLRPELKQAMFPRPMRENQVKAQRRA
jgi:hypothetical protein